MRKIFETTAVHNGLGATCAILGPRTGNVLATGGRDKEICLWTLTERTPVYTLTGFISQVECVLFSWSETQVAGGNMSGGVKIWDIKENQVTSNFTGHRGKVKCLAQNPFDHNLWASGAFDGHVKLWDSTSNKCVLTYKGHSNRTVTCMEFSPDGRWLVTGGEDCKIKLFDITAGKVLADVPGHSGPLTSVQFHPNEYLLASSSQDKTVRFWDMETYECVSQSPPDSAGAIKCILFDPNGRCLFSASCGGGLRALGWEPARLYDSDSCPNSWADCWRGVTALALAPSQQTLIAVCLGGTDENGANSISAFSIDATRLRPIYGGPEGPQNAEQQVDVENNQNGGNNNDFCLGNSMRRSFHKSTPSTTTGNKSSPPAITVKRENEEPETSDSMRRSFHKFSPSTTTGDKSSPPAITVKREEDESEISVTITHSSPPSTIVLDDKTLAFKSRPKVPRSPPRTPVPSDPAGDNNTTSGEDTTFGSTFTVVAAVAPQRAPSTPINNALARQPSPARVNPAATKITSSVPSAIPSSVAAQSKTKSTAAVPPISGNATRKVVHEVPPLVRGTSPAPTTTRANSKPRAVEPKKPTIFVNEQRQSSLNDDDQFDADAQFSNATDFNEQQPSNHGRKYSVSPEDFLPQQQSGVGAFSTTFTVFHEPTMPSPSNVFRPMASVVTEEDCLAAAEKGAVSMSVVLDHRAKTLNMVRGIWRSRGPLAAVEMACQMNDPSVVVDLLNILNFRSNIWKLDLCVALLPQLRQLLDSKYETYVHTAVNSLRLVLRNFGHVIKSGLQNAGQVPSIGVDISHEERVLKCKKCYDELAAIRDAVLRKQKLINAGSGKTDGRNRHTYRELSLLMQTLDV